MKKALQTAMKFGAKGIRVRTSGRLGGHGEMLMLGSYATYATQTFFQAHLPGAFRWYLLAAIPMAFLVTLLVGMLLERTDSVSSTGGRLETLLATWGISLGLIQTVRLIFGAQNAAVANPDWPSGGIELTHGLVLLWSRIGVIGFVSGRGGGRVVPPS